jgi:hypothetical protein
MTKTPPKRMPPAKRIDVTRLEYENLLAIAERNADAIKRLREDMAIQLRRTAEVQHELDKLKKDVLPPATSHIPDHPATARTPISG